MGIDDGALCRDLSQQPVWGAVVQMGGVIQDHEPMRGQPETQSIVTQLKSLDHIHIHSDLQDSTDQGVDLPPHTAPTLFDDCCC